jgi:nicotinamide-nucleotide adenylyltransferase
MSKFAVGLVIGRFQPFHKGHLFMIREALKIADTLVIALGSSNISNESNPFTFEQRKAMFDEILKHEHLKDKIRRIVPSPDFASDKQWANELIKNAGHFDLVISNNDWTCDVMQEAGYKIERIPFFEREKYQATFVRDLMKTGGDWQERVPGYIIDFLKKTTNHQHN